MYTRSYKVEYHPEELKWFKKDIKYRVSPWGYALGFHTHINNYPYDIKDGKRVKTLHLTIRYWNSVSWGSLKRVKKKMEWDGFDIQENSQENKSIPEIPHFHAVKVLEYL